MTCSQTSLRSGRGRSGTSGPVERVLGAAVGIGDEPRVSELARGHSEQRMDSSITLSDCCKEEEDCAVCRGRAAASRPNLPQL